MSDYVNEALLGANPLKKQSEESKVLVEKWDKTGLLDGLNEDFQKSGMAVMLENQAKQLVQEASYTNPSGGSGDEEWSGVALPLVRRIFGEIAAQDFVSVQPMNLPSGLVFYLDFRYGTAVDGRTTSESVFGKTGTKTPSGSSAPFGEDGLYGVGKYGYTLTGSTVAVDFGGFTLPTFKDLNFDSELSASSAGKLWKITGSLAGADELKADELSIRGWNVIESGSAAADNTGSLRALQSIDGGVVTLIVSRSAALENGILNVTYFKQPTDSTRGDYEDKTGNATTDSLNIPEVNLDLKSSPIVAKTRKLKAIWTPELAQDLNAYHSVDAEAELTSMLSEYISMEIDLEILDMLISDALTVDYWSARQGNDYDASTSSFKNTTFTGTRFEWWQTLVAKIQKVSNEIHRLTLRGGANFCVVGPKVATILESLPGYMSDTDGDKAQFAMGVSKVGSINSRFQVYKNPYMTENTILVGFRGSNFLETGAVYAPYVPLIMTPLVYDPSDFTPRKGVMTRYAKKMIRPEFYAKVHVADLDLI